MGGLCSDMDSRYGLGDLNDDGVLNVLDVIQIVNIITGMIGEPSEYQLMAGDVNQSGDIDILDVVQLVNAILGIIELPSWIDRVLFIGNSYTASNGGLATHLEGLVREIHPGWQFEAEQITYGGFTLENHFNTPATLETIQSGSWDIVILQEQSTRPLDNPELMFQYADSLDSYISASGAHTMFFMTWARENDPEMIIGLSNAYEFIADELGAMLAPVGLAFTAALATNPEIDLYAADGSHPSGLGTYLSACVFFAAILDESPVGNDYNFPQDMTDEERIFLQTVAWESVRGFDTIRQQAQKQSDALKHQKN